jgi:hypothetical protein
VNCCSLEEFLRTFLDHVDKWGKLLELAINQLTWRPAGRYVGLVLSETFTDPLIICCMQPIPTVTTARYYNSHLMFFKVWFKYMLLSIIRSWKYY